MASTFGRISRRAKVAADSAIQRCSSSRCSNVKILSALSLTGVVRNAVPASVGFMVVDICDFFSLNYDALNDSLRLRFNTLPMSVFGRLSRNSMNLGTLYGVNSFLQYA